MHQVLMSDMSHGHGRRICVSRCNAAIVEDERLRRIWHMHMHDASCIMHHVASVYHKTYIVRIASACESG